MTNQKRIAFLEKKAEINCGCGAEDNYGIHTERCWFTKYQNKYLEPDPNRKYLLTESLRREMVKKYKLSWEQVLEIPRYYTLTDKEIFDIML